LLKGKDLKSEKAREFASKSQNHEKNEEGELAGGKLKGKNTTPREKTNYHVSKQPLPRKEEEKNDAK